LVYRAVGEVGAYRGHRRGPHEEHQERRHEGPSADTVIPTSIPHAHPKPITITGLKGNARLRKGDRGRKKPY
jgi:hypothetical protein